MTAQKATGPDRANDQPRQESIHAPIVTPAEKTGKSLIEKTAQFRDLDTRLTHRGFALSVMPNGRSVAVSRWGLVRIFDSLVDVEQFAAQVGAA